MCRTITFINKLDRAGANHNVVIKAIQDRIPITTAAIQLPIGLEHAFEGIIDLITQKAYYFYGNFGTDIQIKEIPTKYLEEVKTRRDKLLETLADVDEVFADKYLNGDDLTADDIHQAIRRSTIALKFSPIMMGSAYKNKGVQLVLDVIGAHLPSPGEVENKALHL